MSYLSGDLPWLDPDELAIYHVDLRCSAGQLKNLSAVSLRSSAPRLVKGKATNHMGVNTGHNPAAGSCSG